MSDIRVAVIGAGYAGMAAAVELARARLDVTVFESSRVLGGRARVVEKDGYRLDNGQHILLGAYTETLKLLRLLGVSPKRLHACPFSLHIPERLTLRAASLPAPFHLAVGLLRARGLTWRDRLALLRLIRYLKGRNYQLGADYSVSELLTRADQTAQARELIWEPLCIAALNTLPDQASAQIFANVLRDSVGASGADAEMLIPRIDLSELLPVPATRYLNQHGCVVYTATPIGMVHALPGGFGLDGDPGEGSLFTHVIVATAPFHVNRLLEEFTELTELRRRIDAFAYEPITTVYLAYSADIRLPEPMLALTGTTVQWLFDRGQLGGVKGLLAAVISARGGHTDMAREQIAGLAHQAVASILPGILAPHWSQVITEKRATFSCQPGVLRPTSVTAVPNLFLAGDYVDSPYPATIEAAVRSGLNAARQIIRTAHPEGLRAL